MHNSWNHANIHGTPFGSWIFIQSLYHPDLSLRFSNWTLLHDIRWIFSSLVRLLGLESKKTFTVFGRTTWGGLFSLIIYLRHWYLYTTAAHIKSYCFPLSIQDSQIEKSMKILVVFAFAFVAIFVVECCVSGMKLIIFIYNKLDSFATNFSCRWFITHLLLSVCF